MKTPALIPILTLAVSCLAQAYEPCILIQSLVVGSEPLKCYIPWLTSLRDRNDEHFCAGSLISSTIVLTAAHCLDEADRLKTVDIGRVHRQGDDGSGCEKREVLDTVVHEQYDMYSGFDYDIALLILNAPSWQEPAPLARDLYCVHTPRGCAVQLVGWGSFTKLGPLADTLMTASSRSITIDSCKAEYSAYSVSRQNFTLITDRMICTKKNGTSICDGDSGGPVMIKGQVVGIVSFMNECADPKSTQYPGVSISVPRLRGWIDSKLAELS